MPRTGAGDQRGATPSEGILMQIPMIENLVQFTHLEKTYGYLPGMSEATYREIQDRFDENARATAQEFLGDPSLAGRVDRLPFQAGKTVLGVGDSFTDDLQSWLEIVRHLLELRRPQERSASSTP